MSKISVNITVTEDLSGYRTRELTASATRSVIDLDDLTDEVDEVLGFVQNEINRVMKYRAAEREAEREAEVAANAARRD